MNYFTYCIKHYADFNGRARRKEYWMFVLFNGIFSIVASILDLIFGLHSSDLGIGVFSTIYSLALFIPGLAVTTRRLHDVGRSGWFILLALIPIVGAIILLVWEFTDGNPGMNEYGPNPKEIEQSYNY